MNQDALRSELENCSQEDLALILETQQELYSDEELEQIESRLTAMEKAEKTSKLGVLCYILSCVVPFFGWVLGWFLLSNPKAESRKLGSDMVICGCLPLCGLGVILSVILLFSRKESRRTLGKRCMATSFISLILLSFWLSGGFKIG